jgi:hypothetical protein
MMTGGFGKILEIFFATVFAPLRETSVFWKSDHSTYRAASTGR